MSPLKFQRPQWIGDRQSVTLQNHILKHQLLYGVPTISAGICMSPCSSDYILFPIFIGISAYSLWGFIIIRVCGNNLCRLVIINHYCICNHYYFNASNNIIFLLEAALDNFVSNNINNIINNKLLLSFLLIVRTYEFSLPNFYGWVS